MQKTPDFALKKPGEAGYVQGMGNRFQHAVIGGIIVVALVLWAVGLA